MISSGTPEENVGLSLQYIIKCISMLERSGLPKAIVALASQATQFSEKVRRHNFNAI